MAQNITVSNSGTKHFSVNLNARILKITVLPRATPTHFEGLLSLTISTNFLELRDLRSLTGIDYL
ncbi:hypothetical protein [Nostoc sp.]|uniref:hypothetical protein n=1 Tax=Nostoc sp. TaxID=1180 RepID=UPI002FFC569C